jgi:hypothetical protein
MNGTRPAAISARSLALAVALACGLGIVLVATASGERSQTGDLISSLDGGLSPLALPRERPAPVSVHLKGGLQSADGGLVPRVTRLELGLPAQGVVSTRGLPACPARSIHDARPAEALAACRPALVGRGSIEARVALPGQGPISVRSRVLVFNARTGHGGRGVLLHAYSADPPTVAVLPLSLRRGQGRFGFALAGRLPAALGPWPRLSRFEITLHRRYSYRGERRSYLSASCPIPKSFTAGFFSFAKASYRLAGGQRISTGIARGCRAR